MSKSRQKALARIDRVERPEDTTGPNIQFRADTRSADEVMHARGYAKVIVVRTKMQSV
jgi:hypothetical protein